MLYDPLRAAAKRAASDCCNCTFRGCLPQARAGHGRLRGSRRTMRHNTELVRSRTSVPDRLALTNAF